MAMPAEKRRKREVVGSPTPRIAPPLPARSDAAAFIRQAADIGLDLFPWQRTAAKYLYATHGESFVYRTVAIVVARQNGKTELILPHILRRLEMGRRIVHATQHRELTRYTFNRLIPLVTAKWPDVNIRRAAGQETIETPNGGYYKIIADKAGAPRGLTIDDVIVDELREIKEEFLGALLPTQATRPNRQALFFSNAGDDTSEALNKLRARAELDPSLAYLEWSASPERRDDDVVGWAEANPSMGHFPGMMEFLSQQYESNRLSGTLAIFETEHLCRWVATMRERLIRDEAWQGCSGALDRPLRPVLGVSMDPEGKRASIAVAWKTGETVGLKMLYDVTGSPIDTDRLGTELRALATKMGVKRVGYDPYTDAELVKYVHKPESINGGQYANASAQFVNLVNAGKLRWQDCDAVTSDLAFTARKPTGESSFHAVRSDDDRPITASLAAIRAVWLASGPQPALARVM